ncbi:hypothetical protein BDW74DRAFT_176182 [Aspergillus multicolor]|uniref:uncharacterized protein n=1 Tax=Aspergillus multicolor TaxID=41759 RepID=UPI003CCD2F2D
MSSQSLEGTGRSRADLADCVATLSVLLHNALTTTAESLPGPHYSCLLIEPPLYTLSSPLLKALLAESSDLPSGSGEMFSFANQHRDVIACALETVSLRCLSAYLFKLTDNNGLELGLHLLTNEPEYTAESYITQSEINAPESESLLPLVQKRVIEKAYLVFADGTGDARLRRMAGKALTGMIHDPEKRFPGLDILKSDDGLSHEEPEATEHCERETSKEAAGSSQRSQESGLDAEVGNEPVKKLAETNGSSLAREAENVNINSPPPDKKDRWNSQSMTGFSLNQCQNLAGNNQGRGQTVAEKLIAALRGSSSPKHPADETCVDELFGNAGYEVQAVPEMPEAQNEPVLKEPLAEQEGRENDKQDDSGSWASNIIQEGIPGDEMYPVKIYSVESSDASRNSSSQNNGEQKWVLRKKEALLKIEEGRENKRGRHTSSQVASSSMGPLSKESTPEVYYSSPSLKERKLSPCLSRPDEAAPATKTFKAYSTKPSFEEQIPTSLDHTQKIASASSKQNTTHAISEGTASKKYRLQIPSYDNRADAPLIPSVQKGLVKDGAGCAAGFPDSSTKTVVDKNGSPRLKQQLSAAKEEHTIPKRRGNYSMSEQRNPKRVKESDQKDALGLKLPTASAHAIDTHGAFAPTEKSKTNLVTPHTNSNKTELRNPFLSRLQASAGERLSKDLKSTLLGLNPSQEQRQTLGSKEHASKTTAEDESEQKLTFGLSEGAAERLDWQTSLRKLHQGMERTIISNNEYLSRQIDSERATINGVLNGYKEQCHNVLDQLFEAQMERIRMCKQQMNSIKQQHADVCQGLIRQLEENERTLDAAGGSQ